MKKGVKESLKSNAVDNIIDKINKTVLEPHGVNDTPNLINPYIEEIEHILRNTEYEIRCVVNKLYEGFVFIAWLEGDQLFTRIIKL